MAFRRDEGGSFIVAFFIRFCIESGLDILYICVSLTKNIKENKLLEDYHTECICACKPHSHLNSI